MFAFSEAVNAARRGGGTRSHIDAAGPRQIAKPPYAAGDHSQWPCSIVSLTTRKISVCQKIGSV
jgi:hypothetical protein